MLFFIFLLLLSLAIGIPILVESKVHPRENTLIGLKAIYSSIRNYLSDWAWQGLGVTVVVFGVYILYKAADYFFDNHPHFF